MSDGAALDWLERLLTVNEPERAKLLGELAATDPALHVRVERMLTSALSPEHSSALARPVLAGLNELPLAATQALRAGDVLAGYRLIRELGRGGMSVVWLAERADGVVKRHVALKMPMFLLQSDVERVRFERERDVLAALSHPNVARLYDAGVLPSGQPFLVLEFVDGAPLLDYCQEQHLDERSRLALFLQVLAAVDHAHKHLVVHRDIKPSNILVDAERQVKLLDFGIAKLVAERETPTTPLTELAGGALTPLYAAPEQLRGGAISTLTDVFSLGVVLHELLTGALPYPRPAAGAARASLVEVLEAQSRGELRAQLGGDVATIVGKALRIAPESRYASVAHFSEDVVRYLRRLPIAARRPSVAYRARLMLERHKLASGLAAIGLVAVTTAALVAWQQHRDSQAHAARAAAVRDFMFDLVNDAEASEGETGEITGKQMVAGAVARAERDYGEQPQLQGELLGELGRMYMRLGAVEDAVPVLRSSIAVLETQATPGDPALNKARAFLADALLQSTQDLPLAQQLATRAREDCVSPDVDCAKARAYAGHVLSQVASIRGDDAAALADMRQSAADVEQAFGAQNGETAMAFVGLAMSARNAGALAEAGDAMRRAVAIARGVRLRAADRTMLDRSSAIIDLDLGRYEAARDRLITLLAQKPSPFERALQQRLLATVYVELGDAPRALQAAELAVQGTADNPGGPAHAYAVQARARALALAGRTGAALADIDAVLAALADSGSAPDSFEILRAQRYRAEFLALANDPAALTQLRELAARHARLQGSPVERGLVLEALAAAERRAGNGNASQLAQRAARDALAKQLPADHPYLSRHVVREKS